VRRKTTWAVTEAKAKLSDLVDAAMKGEPQVITRRGSEAVVVLSMKAYRSAIEGRRDSLVEFFAKSPFRDVDLAPPRDRETGREIEL
jgi:prevent-host-death family protein